MWNIFYPEITSNISSSIHPFNGDNRFPKPRSSEQSTALQQIYDQFKKQTKVSKKSLAAGPTLEPYLVYSKEAQNPVAFFTRRREHWDLGVEWDLWLPW